jgi:hypothetical protein
MARAEDQKLVAMNITKTMEKREIENQQDDWKMAFRVCSPVDRDHLGRARTAR